METSGDEEETKVTTTAPPNQTNKIFPNFRS